jgi:hypothetical protein
MKAMTGLIGGGLIFVSGWAQALIFGPPSWKVIDQDPLGRYEICWMTSGTPEMKNLTRELEDYVLEQLQDRVGLPLVFSEDCLKENDPFRPIGLIFYDDADLSPGLRGAMGNLPLPPTSPGHPITYSRGTWTEENLIDLVLTSRFQDVSEALKIQAKDLSPQGRKNLLKSIALHEILHAFGFQHEHAHPDSECHIGGEAYVPGLYTVLTPYDPDSIMNYCNTHTYDFEISPLPLTDRDIEGIRKKY